MLVKGCFASLSVAALANGWSRGGDAGFRTQPTTVNMDIIDPKIENRLRNFQNNYNMFDGDNSGRLCLREWIHYCSLKGVDEFSSKSSFEAWDVDKSGDLSLGEFFLYSG
jgi:hypothetical protein